MTNLLGNPESLVTNFTVGTAGGETGAHEVSNLFIVGSGTFPTGRQYSRRWPSSPSRSGSPTNLVARPRGDHARARTTF